MPKLPEAELRAFEQAFLSKLSLCRKRSPSELSDEDQMAAEMRAAVARH